MEIETTGLHHIALRVTELRASRHFYGTTLGFPVVLEGAGIFLFLAGRTAVAVRAADDQTPVADTFNPHRVGLDHLAIACSTEHELRQVTAALSLAGVPNTGIRVDPTLNREYVAFKDPDGIAWEYYMAPDTTRDAVQKYFDGLTSGRLDTIPFSSAISFESPLSAPLRGVTAVCAFLEQVLPAIRGIAVQHMIVDGEHAGVRFTLDTDHGLVPAFDFFRVVNGEIVEARPFYDPRPLLAPPRLSATVGGPTEESL